MRRPGQDDIAEGGLAAVLLDNRAALLRFLRARGGSADAEDLLQDLWIKLSVMSPDGPIADPLSYLYRVADNLIHDRRRAAHRREKRETSWGDMAADIDPAVSEKPSAERELIARGELARIERALAALGERTATIFRRFRLDGVGQKTIAGEQGISLSAVEKHLQRAYRAIMAARIAEDDAGLDAPRRLEAGNAVDAAR